MIEKIPLPVDSGESRSDALEIANQFCKRVLACNSNQRMQMIGHQQKQL